jgi:hypothetical protein
VETQFWGTALRGKKYFGDRPNFSACPVGNTVTRKNWLTEDCVYFGYRIWQTQAELQFEVITEV